MSSIGHNKPPVTPPQEQDVLDDLKGRYPEVLARIAEFEAALKEYPKELGLADEDRAAALQDLLGQIKKHKAIIAAHKKSEKGPWSTIVNVVINFFDTPHKRVVELEDEWQPVHQAYMDKVKAEKIRKQEEEAERQRKKEEEARKAAEAAQREAEAAAQREAEARRKEEEARAAQAKAEEDARKAEEARIAAAAEEKRLAKEKADRERAEKDRNEDNLKAIRRHMKDATKLHDAAGEQGDDTPEEDVKALDALIRTGGIIGVLAQPVASSMLLTDEQTAEITEIKAKLDGMRASMNQRLDAKERRKRAAAEKKAQEEANAAAEARRLQREEDDRKAEEARKAREKAEADQKEAEEAARKAKGDVREAREDARDAVKDQKLAGREAKAAEVVADRAANAADKIEDKLENASDSEIAGTLRGELGTRGSLTRRWTLRIMDEDALRAACGPLGPTFTEDALNGAAYRWMMARISGWSGKERVDGNDVGLPGVIFAYQQGTRIA